MRRILQRQGAEVVHLGHTRSVDEVVTAAIQEDVQGVAISSYQGGHVERPFTPMGVRCTRDFMFLVTLPRMRYDPQIMPNEPIFANSKGTYRDPANVGKWIRQAPEVAGYPWLTSHVLRKTAATILGEGGFGATQIADVVGHANPALTQNVYLHRGGPSDAAASALDAALRPHTT